MADFRVVVGNIGTVYAGSDAAAAFKAFEDYADLSFRRVGRAAGEDVTAFENGEIVAEQHIMTESEEY
jgi:hypothetical protein